MKVLSLYDYTGIAVEPWAKRGFQCICYDIQHEAFPIKTVDFPSGGSITYVKADLHNESFLKVLSTLADVSFLMAFPVCTDLAVSGAAWFKKKEEADPEFQTKASSYARWCGDLGEALGCPYMVENPVSRLSTLWRKPDHSFHPFEYGGYLSPEEEKHPQWPEYIPDRDAYSKKTCLWTGGGFVMPDKKEVECFSYGASPQHSKLGGKSAKTKNIRSATPRGFAEAVCQANKKRRDLNLC
jgi:hypothetical protein